MDLNPDSQKSRLEAFYNSSRMIIFILLLAGAPLFITRFSYESYDLPKWVWISVLTKLLIGIYLAGILYNKPVRLMFSPINALLAGYVLLKIISGIWAESPSLWWDDVQHVFTVFAGALLLQDFLYGNRQRLLFLIWALAISAAVTAIWTLYQDFGVRFYPASLRIYSRLGDWRGSLAAGLGNSGYIADFLAILFPMNFLLYLNARGKPREIFTLFTLSVSYAALVVCWSVQSNLGLIIAALFLLYCLIRFKSRWFWKRKRLRLTVLLAAFIVITIFYSVPHPLNPHSPSIFKQAFSSERWKYGGESRLVIWAQSLEIVRNNPWLGTGAGNLTYVYPSQQSPFLTDDESMLKYIGQYTNSAHNEILQSWSELGVAGPALLFILLVVLFRALWKDIEDTSVVNRCIRIGAVCALICAIPPAMMAYPLRLPSTLLLFFGIAAIPVILVPTTRRLSENIQIPVEFRWRNVRIDVFMENFSKPVGGSFSMTMKPWKARIFIIVTGLLIFAWIVPSTFPLISDTLFKRGKTVTEAYYRGLASRKQAEEAADDMRRALKWWPQHHDCRSTLGQLLFRLGKFKEAEIQLRKTLERLQAAEIHEFLARSLEMQCKTREAAQHYLIYFQRNPIMISERPDFYVHARRLIREEIGISEED